MIGERIKTNILSVQMLPNADPLLLRNLKVPKAHHSLGIFTTDCDDVSYAALDEATKKADVQVVYARSMYAGSGNASTKLAGEFIGILSGPDPAEVRSGLEAAIRYIENDAAFYTANDDGSIVYFAQLISRTGSYLSKAAGVSGAESRPSDAADGHFDSGAIQEFWGPDKPYQRFTRAPAPPMMASTSPTVAMEVSPGVVIASAPWAAP